MVIINEGLKCLIYAVVIFACGTVVYNMLIKYDATHKGPGAAQFLAIILLLFVVFLSIIMFMGAFMMWGLL